MSSSKTVGPGTLYGLIIKDFANTLIEKGIRLSEVDGMHAGSRNRRPTANTDVTANVVSAWVKRLKALDSIDIYALNNKGGNQKKKQKEK